MITDNIHTMFGVTGFVEFSDSEVPALLLQSKRAGARLARDERYVSVNRDFTRRLQLVLKRVIKNTLADVWDEPSYQLLQPAFEQCVTQGPQMVRGCRLPDDPFHGKMDLLLLYEPETDTILQILFESPADTSLQGQNDELRRLRSIVDLAPVLISIKDRQSIIRLTNRLFNVLDGPDADAYLNRSVFELFPREVAEELWKNDLAVFHKGGDRGLRNRAASGWKWTHALDLQISTDEIQWRSRRSLRDIHGYHRAKIL